MELSSAEGSSAEVYSRIVGYYRSVRNWNKGKREEYDERKLFSAEKFERGTGVASTGSSSQASGIEAATQTVTASVQQKKEETREEALAQCDREREKLLLFVRPTCPQCPQAKTAASGLGIPVETVDAATDAGLAEAAKRNVYSTPTAILISHDGREISRARDSRAIAEMKRLVA
jgi:ribonucleoside-triphosphate reductase